MIAAAHVMAGLVAGVAALSAPTNGARVVLGFGLGVLTHVVLDAVPHSDYGSLGRSLVILSVAVETAAVLGLGWFLLRSRRLPGLLFAVPAGLAGAMMPDVKFLRYFLPPPGASWVLDLGSRFHGPFHAQPTTVAVGLPNEILSTLALCGLLLFLIRRQDRLRARS